MIDSEMSSLNGLELDLVSFFFFFPDVGTMTGVKTKYRSSEFNCGLKLSVLIK